MRVYAVFMAYPPVQGPVAEEAIQNRGLFKLSGHICMEKNYIQIEGQ